MRARDASLLVTLGWLTLCCVSPCSLSSSLSSDKKAALADLSEQQRYLEARNLSVLETQGSRVLNVSQPACQMTT